MNMTRFSNTFLTGLGYFNGSLKADINNDKNVTIGEIYSYLQKKYEKTYSIISNGKKYSFAAIPLKYGNISFSFSPIPQKVVSIKLNKSSISTYIGKTVTLKATVSGTKNKVSWSSSNSKIATVKNGKVTGKKAGTAKITAKVGGKTATCIVIVKGYVTSAKKLTKKEQHKLYENTIKSYAKSMKNGARKWNEDSGLKTYFAFVDIDKNGTDELIVRAVNSTMKQTTASTSGYGENTHIYTIKNNKVKKVLGNSTYAPTIGHVNYVRVYKNCKYIDRGFSHLPADYIFYKYSNGTLASKPTYRFAVGGWGTNFWSINGKNVSKNDCMKQLNKVSGKREGYPMHKYSASTYKNYL